MFSRRDGCDGAGGWFADSVDLELLSDSTMKSVERALDLVPVKKPVFSYCAGSPLPHGVHLHKGGVNFALFSRHATRVWLLLFEDIHATEPFQTIELDPRHHKTGDMWHICIEGAGRGLVYAYRVDGPNAPEHGHRFDSRRILLDPYATALASPLLGLFRVLLHRRSDRG